tara:strand:- start:50 stop:418 length:369 start_codon:yes stop_codon:yes gene_type:complete
MLNTDLHNSSIKEEKKISIEEYIRNCRGINDGEDFDPDFLRKIYKKIKDDQISLKEDDDLRDGRLWRLHFNRTNMTDLFANFMTIIIYLKNWHRSRGNQEDWRWFVWQVRGPASSRAFPARS